MTVNLSALAGAGQQFFDNNGNPLSGGKLWSYQAGTTTPQTTYTTASGNVAHTNPIILSSAGRVATGQIWLTAGENYKFSLFTSADVLIATWDNITGINGTGITSNAINVVYDPAGTSAVPTTVQAKLRESVSVLDFGADPTGGTDSTNAAQNAWDAVTAANGGVLYFPAGTYRINIVGSGSDNVSIVGDGVSSILVSDAANDWAVKYETGFPDGALFVKDLNFKDATGAKTSHGLYINTGAGLSLENVSFSGLGIAFCNNSTFGFSFDSCRTSNNYVDYFSTTSTGANTSIANINGQTVQITDAFFPQHPGIMVFKNCTMGGRVNHYYEQPDNPFNKEAAIQYINCTSIPAGGCGFYYNNAGWTHNVTMTQMWFEGSLASTPIRAITLPAVYVYSNSCDVTINNSFLGAIEITDNVICKLNNCIQNETITLTASGRASFIGDGIVCDGLGGVKCDFFIQGARNRGPVGRGPYFHTTPKTNINRAYSGQKLSSNRCFAADSLFANFGATQTKIITDSAFETLECFEIAAPSTNGVYPFGTVALDNTKVYVITMALKAAGAPFAISMSTALGGFSVTIPTGRFQTYAIVGSPSVSGNDGPLLRQATGSAQTWYVSGVQYLEFDNYSQVYEFLASSSFAI
jgi:hypothetical protein